MGLLDTQMDSQTVETGRGTHQSNATRLRDTQPERERQTDRWMDSQDPLLNEHSRPEAGWTDYQLAQMLANKNAVKVLRKRWTG